MRRLVDGFTGRVGLALMVALVVTLALATVVSAQPQAEPQAPQQPELPHLFYGDVRTVRGKLLAPGSEVTAKDDSGSWLGTVKGQVDATSRYGWDGLFVVPGYDWEIVDGDIVVLGMRTGDPIAFYVLGVRAQVCDLATGTCDLATGTWLDTYPKQWGGYTNLNLKVAISYTITASAGANGSITPSGAVKVDYGFDQAFTITAATDYLIKELLVDGVAVPAAADKTSYPYTFTNVTANHTIQASFVKAWYTITPSATVGCTIAPSTPVIVPYKGSQSFTIGTLAGYDLVDVKVDNVSQGAIKNYTFSNVQADHTIAAECKRVARVYLPLAMR
jgi:hypothetical protein